MLKLENVSKIYYTNGIVATGISKVNLELNIGEFVVITGESGSGKSTLLNVISGIDSYEEGEMYINGKETSHYTEKDFEEYRKKYIANIFQSFNLINSYTVYQNVELVLLLNGYKRKQIKKKVLDIIDKVGLTKFKNTKVSKLSGGQKQRVAIARAIVKDTPIIVADEPTGNLDTKSAYEIIELLKNVAKDKLVVIVTHNIEQVEKYATRIIKMHDGRMIQNTEIKNINEDSKITQASGKNITIPNQYRLGIRNTFNIFSKFILLFIVFTFMSVAFLAEYSAFKLVEHSTEESSGYSANLRDISKERILINKQNREPFTEDDYSKIKQLSNIDYIVEDDISLDTEFILRNDTLNTYGYIKDINNFKGNLDIGRMPENDDEIILKANKDDYTITQMLDETLNSEFSLQKSYREGDTIKTVKIVGIQYNENNTIYDRTFYVSNEVKKVVRSYVHNQYSDMKTLLNDKYVQYNIETSENVEPGTAIVNDDLKYQFKNNKIINQNINISVSNIYYEDNIDLTITKTFTKSNLKKLTGYTDYSYYQNAIIINPDDYNSLYDKPSYQSSVYVKDASIIDQTMSELENLGLKPKKATDFKVEYENESQIVKIFKVVVTIFVIIVVFFISYLIISIILKSRNIYYTTLRMLGATSKSTRKILNIELFINSTLSYLMVLTFGYLVKQDIIKIEFIANLIKYITLNECILMYLILFVVTQLIARKFAKKIFKSSAMNRYNEEV
ncbi:MAG: ABC transporter ATP-binding protein/permease [Clostridium sp.]|nr:ABC transporter ATP-binding protein/permease [Clostridium sp.]